ncbi:MAG: formate dehydrogenase subunit gamma [Rhodobacterales bacterium]|nr:MAG: formate dehydrogenase subunit gamma [Rhodobacterales bacterium]
MTAELDSISALIAPHLGREGPLLPILHDIQGAYGHIPDAALPVIADALNLIRAEVHGVVSFYHDFREAPAGKHMLKICRAEACQAMGGAANADALLKALGTDWHGTTAQGVTVEPVYCLGLCACAPAAMLDDRVIGRATPARVQKALEGTA